MKLSELNASDGKAVNIWCADLSSKHTEITVTRVIQHNEHYVWTLVGNRIEGNPQADKYERCPRKNMFAIRRQGRVFTIKASLFISEASLQLIFNLHAEAKSNPCRSCFRLRFDELQRQRVEEVFDAQLSGDKPLLVGILAKGVQSLLVVLDSVRPEILSHCLTRFLDLLGDPW